jgi:hypothetical protein
MLMRVGAATHGSTILSVSSAFALLHYLLQVEALSDRLLGLFKEAHLDLGALLAAQGLHRVSNESKR